MILSMLGLSPIYCVGWIQEVDGENHYHAWVRVGSYNLEQSTLNLQHYEAVDYDDPVVTFNNTSSFIDRMDMLSPIRWLM
jgi:desulfoferrodoxin (superoxide reductase-like protein)